jgi:hypothetical protein
MLASQKKTKRGVLGAVVLASILAVGGFAYTNVIAVDDVTNAGDGFEFVSDLAVDDESILWENDLQANPGTGDASVADNVVFKATATDPAVVNHNGAAGFLTTTVAYIQVVSVAGAGLSTPEEWFECVIDPALVNGATTADFTCDLSGGTTPVEFRDVDQFRAVIHDAA